MPSEVRALPCWILLCIVAKGGCAWLCSPHIDSFSFWPLATSRSYADDDDDELKVVLIEAMEPKTKVCFYSLTTPLLFLS